MAFLRQSNKFNGQEKNRYRRALKAALKQLDVIMEMACSQVESGKTLKLITEEKIKVVQVCVILQFDVVGLFIEFNKSRCLQFCLAYTFSCNF